MVKIVGVSQILVVLTTKEINYLVVGLFDNLVARFCIFICDINIFACADFL